MLRIAIAEDHAIARWALGEVIAGAGDMMAIGTATTVDEALALVRREKPDVLLLALTLPDHSGYDVLKAIGELDASPLVVVLSPHTDPTYGVRAIHAGAHAYLHTSTAPLELLAAIRAVARGECLMPPTVEAILAAGDSHPASALSKRELQVMEMIARGVTNREIAAQLELSVKTVDTHRGHVLKKLGLRNNAELTRFAVRHGYVTV